MAFKYPSEGPILRGAAPCQPRRAVARVPPCPRALAPPMTQECVRRCHPTPAHGRAPAPHLPLGGPIPLALEISPAMVQRFERFFRGGLPTPQPTQAPSALPQGEPSHGGVAPCQSPLRCRLLDLGDFMERRLPVRGVEHVARPGKQRLDVLPPLTGPLTDHTPPALLLWHHPRLCDRLEGRTQVCRGWSLVPAQEMDAALVIAPRKPNALGRAPLAVPRGASGSRGPRPSVALPSAGGTRGPVRPIAAQPHHRTAPAPRRQRRHAARPLLP